MFFCFVVAPFFLSLRVLFFLVVARDFSCRGVGFFSCRGNGAPSPNWVEPPPPPDVPPPVEFRVLPPPPPPAFPPPPPAVRPGWAGWGFPQVHPPAAKDAAVHEQLMQARMLFSEKKAKGVVVPPPQREPVTPESAAAAEPKAAPTTMSSPALVSPPLKKTKLAVAVKKMPKLPGCGGGAGKGRGHGTGEVPCEEDEVRDGGSAEATAEGPGVAVPGSGEQPEAMPEEVPMTPAPGMCCVRHRKSSSLVCRCLRCQSRCLRCNRSCSLRCNSGRSL